MVARMVAAVETRAVDADDGGARVRARGRARVRARGARARGRALRDESRGSRAVHVGRWAGVLRRGARVGDERVFLRRRVHVARRDANGGRGVVRELVLDRANDGRERFAVRARGGESTTGGFVAVAVVVAVERRRRELDERSGRADERVRDSHGRERGRRRMDRERVERCRGVRHRRVRRE